MNEEFNEIDLSELINATGKGERHFTVEFAKALSKFQSELPSAKKTSSGYGYNYSDLGTVIETAKPLLAKNGFSVTQLLCSENKEFIKIETILLHESMGRISSICSLPAIDMKGCNSAQSAGATVSYLRRYAYQAILGMASEDSDASSKGGTKSEAKKEVKKTVAKKANNRWS